MRAFWAALPTEGRWLLSTVAIQTLGRGLTLPFTLIYLHEVRGFDLGLAGTLMALIAVVGLLVTGPSAAFDAATLDATAKLLASAGETLAQRARGIVALPSDDPASARSSFEK